MLDRGLRRERLDHASGEHLGERVSAAEVRRQLVEEARGISCEGAAASARMERAPAAAHESQPAQSVVERLENRDVGLAMWRTEQLRVPPVRPALGRLAHYRSRQSVCLRKRDPAARGGIKKPPRGRSRVTHELRLRLRRRAHALVRVAAARSAHARQAAREIGPA